MLSLLSSLLLACSNTAEYKVPFYTDASYTPIWKIDAQAKNNLNHIAPFRFTNQYGRTFSSEDLKGKIYLANFFFTTCKGICPKMTNNIKKIYQHFEGNPRVLFLSHSVTPEIDSVAKLKAYADANDIHTPQWELLTGKATEIYNLARKSYFVEEANGLSKDSTEFLHTENIVLVDKDGHIRGLYNGTIALDAERAIEDIDALLQE
ncbi:SCO family protein [Taibaiella lutea]|uniref:SCO family protein n=2 Tax=Taibaiella lutea TaxID=2608001 RepID=A0A5M6CP47_9BACT|nr:SCO family protein [Taibaiella lutea]